MSAQSWRYNNRGRAYNDRNRARIIENNNRRVNRQNYENYIRQERVNWERQYNQQNRYETNSEQQTNRVSDNVSQKSSEKVVSLVTNGTGHTKEEAIQNALRSAIEQAFGTFVSANTEVINDDLIKDEIVTVSSGNIKEYNELYCTTNGDMFNVNIQTTVSIGSLINYAQNKGMKAELAGATFVRNMKMRKLNKDNELRAMDNLKKQLCIIANSGLFDYQIEIHDPHVVSQTEYRDSVGFPKKDNSHNIAVTIVIRQLINEKTLEFRNTLLRVLNAICLTEQEKKEYDSAGDLFYRFCQYPLSNDKGFYLRNIYDENAFMDIMSFARCFFSIRDNLGNSINPYLRVYKGKIYLYKRENDYRELLMEYSTSKIYKYNGDIYEPPINSSYVPKVYNTKDCYYLRNNYYAPDYLTGYKISNKFIQIGLSGNMLFIQRDKYSKPWSKFSEFIKNGDSIGKIFDSKTLTLLYNEKEIERLNSIQVDPVLCNFDLENLFHLY